MKRGPFTLLVRQPDARCAWVRVTIPARRPYVDDCLTWLRQTFGPSSQLRRSGKVLRPVRQDARWSIVSSPWTLYQGVFRFVVLFDDADAALLRLAFDVREVRGRFLKWEPRAWGTAPWP